MSEDPYRRLEALQNPETLAFIEAQEQRTRALLDGMPGRAGWRAMLERKARQGREEALGGGFFLRTEAGGEREVLMARPCPGADPVVLLDPHTWDGTASLVFAVPSPAGTHVALGRAERGGHEARIQLLDVAARRVLRGGPRGRDQSHVAWLPDGSGFYYSACPEAGDDADHWTAVYLYTLDRKEGRRVFGEDYIREYWCSAEVSECGRFAIFYRHDFVHACDVFLQPIGDAELVPVATGMRSLSRVQVLDEHLLIRTDLEAPRGRCCLAPLSAPAEWRTILPEGEQVLQTVTGVGGRLYAVWSRGQHHGVTVHDREGTCLREVALPSLGTVNHHDGSGVVSGISGTWRGDDVRVRFRSPLQPEGIYGYDYGADQLVPEQVPDPGFTAEMYVMEQVHYASPDGTQVPLLLVRHRDAPRDGRRPVRLTGYGGFGIPFEPKWTPLLATWLESGGMLAFAGIRGGGEYGKAWHDAARGRHRQRALDDYIAAARWLVTAGWTEPARIVSRGNSHGGMLVAAAAMQAPDAFGAVVSRAPLLDMLQFPRFGSLAAATVEYGSPDDPADAAALAAYSPYHNVRADAAYPAMLFIAALEDRIAPPYDPLKMVARLQAEMSRGGPYLLLPLWAAGHYGGATTSAAVEHDLDELCFTLWAVGRTGPGPSGSSGCLNSP